MPILHDPLLGSGVVVDWQGGKSVAVPLDVPSPIAWIALEVLVCVVDGMRCFQVLTYGERFVGKFSEVVSK